jgi:hypothetical protein
MRVRSVIMGRVWVCVCYSATVRYTLFIFLYFWFIFIRIKKDQDQGKEKCHSKSMMSKEANERLKRDTQYMTLRQNAEGKIREKGLKLV